jgi:hypothetical protein
MEKAMNEETQKQAASYGEPDNVRTTELNEADVHSAYLDSDGSLYLYDKDGKDLFGWPKGRPEHIADVTTFLAAREISYVNKPALPAISYAFESDNPQPAPASYGEPWECSLKHDAIFTAGSKVVAIQPDFYFAERASQCVNACAGIADPEKAIQAARDALQKTIVREYAFINDVDEPASKEQQEFVGIIESALAQLNNTK